MTADDVLAAVATLNPRALSSARKLACAIDLIRAGANQSDAAKMVISRYGCSRAQAWRVASMAADMAGPIMRSGRQT